MLADQHTNPNQYSANPTFSYNSRNLTNTIRRTGTGAYDVTFPGLDFQAWPFGYELTAVGSGSAYCNIRGHRYNAAETDKIVDVRCFSSSGNPTDSKFYLKYAPSTHQTPSFATVFAWQKSNQQPYLADFTRSVVDNICGQGPVYDPVTVTRLGTGNYRVSLQSGQIITDDTNTPFGKSIASAVVLPAAGTEYCYVNAYNTTTPPSIDVRCRSNSGFVDAAFYLTFASLNASNCLN